MSVIDVRGVHPLPVPVDVLRIIEGRARFLDVSVLVIGAAARDLVVHAVTGSRSPRATLDVDVAVAVDSAGFSIFTEPWERVQGNEHKFLVLDVEVDVVPFGTVETDRRVELNDGHLLDVNGLEEAARTSVEVQLADDLRMRVASLPAQAALKVLAWRDRHRDNSKDARDLREILGAMAEDPYVDDVWEDSAAMDWSDHDVYLAAAFRVGSLAAAPFATEDGRQVLSVVEDDELSSRLARQMGGATASELLRAFAAGFRSGLRSAP